MIMESHENVTNNNEFRLALVISYNHIHDLVCVTIFSFQIQMIFHISISHSIILIRDQKLNNLVENGQKSLSLKII